MPTIKLLPQFRTRVHPAWPRQTGAGGPLCRRVTGASACVQGACYEPWIWMASAVVFQKLENPRDAGLLVDGQGSVHLLLNLRQRL